MELFAETVNTSRPRMGGQRGGINKAMNQSFKLASVLVALALVIGACAGGGDASPTPVRTTAASTTAPATTAPGTMAPESEAPESTAPESTAPESPGATPGLTPNPSAVPAEAGTLTLWVDGTRAPILLDVGADFTAATNVPVAVHQLGFGDIRDQLQLRGPAGEGPDIIIGAHDWLGQLATNGLVEPLDLGAKADSIDPVGIEAMSYGGTLYGLPYAVEGIAMIYNPDLVPEPPATWDELKQTAQELQDAGTVEQAFVMQHGPRSDPYHSYPVLTGFGGYIFGETESGYNPGDVGLDSEGGLAYAREFDQMVKDGLLRPDVNYDTMISLYNAGDAAMLITGPWALGGDAGIRAGGQPFAVAPIPTMTETPRPFVGVQGFMVSSFAPNKLLAQTFLTEYVATDEVMQALFDADPRPSTWLATAAQVDDENVQGFIESASNGDPQPAIPEMSAVWEAWTKGLDLIWTQAQDPEDAMRDAATTIRGLIAGTGQSPSPAP